ncbi:hypothetical protein LTR56_003323 [Elasticomyces elasticus]|nr:hypothetical protein LTR56_003323 [Elasticomyces elasticus]KAK5766006.1 hypothetical protein LTS12_003752 [Elasticomyces elasticus]
MAWATAASNSELFDELGLLDSLQALQGLKRAAEVDIVELQSMRQQYLSTNNIRYRLSGDHIGMGRSLTTKVNPSRMFEAVLEESRWLAASEIKDLIYALLNLTCCPLVDVEPTNIDHALGIRLDYAKPYSYILQDVTKFIMNRDRSLDVLKLINRATSPSGVVRDGDALPSWTVDWTHYRRAGPALGWQSPSKRDTIAMRGVILCTIQSFSVSYHPEKALNRLSVDARTHLRIVAQGQTSFWSKLYTNKQRPAQIEWCRHPLPVTYKRFLADADPLAQIQDMSDRGLIAALVEGIAPDEVVYLQPTILERRFSYVRTGTLAEHLSLFQSDLPQDIGAWSAHGLFEASKEEHRKFIVV